jgi:hypothetical protein
MRKDVKRDRRYIDVLQKEEERMPEERGREACFRLSFDVADPLLAIARRSAAEDHVGLGLGLRLSSLDKKSYNSNSKSFDCDKMTARIPKELSVKI